MQMSPETANQLTPPAPSSAPEPTSAQPVPAATTSNMQGATAASHMGWLVLSIVLFIIGLVAGAGGGYYLGLQETSQLLETQSVAPETNTQTNDFSSDTTADTSPVQDVKLNPFE